MKRFIHLLVVASFGVSIGTSVNTALANTHLGFLKPGLLYPDVKLVLLEKGWQPIKNKRISHSSLYAQEIYAQGMEEVVDCISMELDACVFRFVKNNQVLEIKTITRQLTLDSFKTKKR